jgi:hypothetical protein
MMTKTLRQQSILAEILHERGRHEEKGYDDHHDDEHNYLGLADLAIDYMCSEDPISRMKLIQAGSLILAAVECYDRNHT